MNERVYYGQWNADQVIASYFPPDYIGTCIEVGGGFTAVDGSNTYYFEKRGWNCLVIEPLFADSCARFRTNVFECAVASINKDDVEFTVALLNGQPWEGMSGLEPDERLIERHRKDGYHIETKTSRVDCRRLDWIIKNYFDQPTIDFITIDTEGSELDVLMSFDINKYNTKLIVLENNFHDAALEEYMKNEGWRKDKVVEVNEFYVRA